MTEQWTVDEYKHWQRTGQSPNRDRATDPVADVEPATRNEPLATNASQALDTPVRIGVISYRTRLADPDGVSAKAAIDGLVEAGVLRDDSAKEVGEVWYRQEKSADEKTVIVIEEM